jgi:hypothetical protein
MEYLEFKPDRNLARYVECYWYAFSDRPPFGDRESLIPDGTIECMFNFDPAGMNRLRILAMPAATMTSHTLSGNSDSLQAMRQGISCRSSLLS